MSKYLESDGENEYLIISIYRSEFVNTDRKELMRSILFHKEKPDLTKTDVRLIDRYTTIYNNRQLGLQIENASVYGSKIEMALDDFDQSLAKKIRKHDIIIIHRINKKKIKLIDMVASAIGINTYSPSGVRDGMATSYITEPVKKKLSKIIDSRVNKMTDFLENEIPIFSGLITNPRVVIGNNAKLAIEAQDMIRILQHMNTEDTDISEIKDIPENLDEFFLDLKMEDLAKEKGLNMKGKKTVNIIRSVILRVLAMAVLDKIPAYTPSPTSGVGAGIAYKTGEGILILTPTQTIDTIRRDVRNYHNILIKPITNSMYLIYITPLEAINLFIEFYTKNTGTNIFFDYDVTDKHNVFQNSDVVQNIFQELNSGDIVFPHFVIGVTLEVDGQVIYYAKDKIQTSEEAHSILADTTLEYVFTQKTLGLIQKNRVTETLLTKYMNIDEKPTHKTIVRQFFMNLVSPSSTTGSELTDTEIIEYLYHQHTVGERKMAILKRTVRNDYNSALENMKTEFNKAISLDYIVSTNFSSVRSVEYNPTLSNQLKSIPITQIIQLFLGAMTVIPVSQSKKTTGFDNTAYNISQRIWLRSAIGFHNSSNTSWYHQPNMKPIIYFSLRYAPAYKKNDTSLNAKDIYLPLEDIINTEMYTLPSNASLSIYSAIKDNIRIGFSINKDNKTGSDNDVMSLGMTNSFDLSTLMGDVDAYVAENVETQLGGITVPTSIPRVGLFELVTAYDNSKASTALRRYDDFGQITEIRKDNMYIYLGYDMYAMNGNDAPIKLRNTNHVSLICPMAFSGATSKGGIIGLDSVFNATRNDTTIPSEWKSSSPDFPADNSVKVGYYDDDVNRFTKYLVTGIQTYYEVTQFISVLKQYLHYIDYGFTGVNGLGDKNLYDDVDLFKIFHNIVIDNDAYYLTTETIGYTDPKPVQETSIKDLVLKLLRWLEKYDGNIEKKRLMMIKYAKDISKINTINMKGDDTAFNVEGIGVDKKYFFHPPNLMSKIDFIDLENKKAVKTVKILASIVRSLSHYMNRIAKESVTGGVVYMPLKTYKNGSILDVGHKITFVKEKTPPSTSPFYYSHVAQNLSDTVYWLKDSVARYKYRPNTELDIYQKPYYIWKTVYYFGGAGTDPQGTSGNTVRAYLTDSGIHWQSSYEEKDITTRITEKMQIQRLDIR